MKGQGGLSGEGPASGVVLVHDAAAADEQEVQGEGDGAGARGRRRGAIRGGGASESGRFSGPHFPISESRGGKKKEMREVGH